jgi:adenylate kinase family enzyme
MSVGADPTGAAMRSEPVLPFQRILVIGCPGAGKSTFARRLQHQTELPIISLDAEFWRPGWIATPRAAWRQRVATLVASDRWIMDGNYYASLDLRLPRADVVIWFDLPRWLCLSRVTKRVALSYGRVRPEMAAGCPERFEVAFMRYIWNFNTVEAPQIREALMHHGSHLTPVIFRRYADAEHFLDSHANRLRKA